MRTLSVIAILTCAPLTSAAETAPTQQRYWVDADPEATERVLRVLDQRLDSSGLDFDEMPLEKVVALLGEEHQLAIILDRQRLDDVGIANDEPITLRLVGVKLSVALDEMLRPLELTSFVRGGTLVITSLDEAYDEMSVAVYPVRDLFGDEPDYHGLLDSLVATVDPDTWAENGGGVAEVRPAPHRGALVISATTRVHEKIHGVLTALRACPLDPNAVPVRRSYNPGPGGGGCGADEHEPLDEPTPADVEPTGGGAF